MGRITRCHPSISVSDFDLRVTERSGDDIQGYNTFQVLEAIFINLTFVSYCFLQISDVSKTSEDEYRISLTTDAVAPFVWLEALGIKGRFCNNGFLMFQQKESVMFYAWQQTDVRTLKESLTIKSLMDIYH